MFKKISKYSYFSFIPFQLLSVLAIYFLVSGVISPLYLLGSLVMWTLVSGLGIACGYHRVFSHKTHVLPIWKENVILFFAALAGQGSSITWVALHRGIHHPKADTVDDIHSPIHGVYESFYGWTTKITEADNPISMRYSVDLMRKPNHVWFHNNCLKLQWSIPLILALIDWKFSLVGICLVTGVSLLQDNLVNVLGHRKGFIGYRNFDTKDNSQNNVLLGYLGWGQGWHNNHHYSPKSFNFGRKWWEIDPCVIWLPFLGKVNV